MTTIFNLLTGEWAQRLGWTLLHSVWQSLLIFSAVSLCLRLISLQRSQLRYAVSCAGLVLVALTAGITFISLDNAVAPSAAAPATKAAYVSFTTYSAPDVSILSQIFTAIPSFIDRHMAWIITAWVAGFLFFALRLILGVVYNQKLILSATPLENEWARYIREVAARLGIKRVVSLAQSAAISTPMVIGFVKPVVLVPVGMLTGLSAEQLQTIFLHELAHIRRYDYLINVFQSSIEAVFFFNPFVGSISGIIRREREYCCDDLVVRQHGGVRAYAHALAQLAESYIPAPTLALAVAGSKNQLLNRIRRIMEKSVGNYSTKRRIMVPAIVLLAGLLCISWLGIQDDASITPNEGEASQDTIIDKKQNGARYSRRSIITIDENGQPHEQVVEEFEGDEKLRPLLKKDIQSLHGPRSLMPAVPPSFHKPALPGPRIPIDTIPPPLGFRDHRNWEEFSRAFEERFGEEFGDLFTFREDDLSKMLKDLEEKFDSEEWSSRFHLDLPPVFDSAQNFFDKESFRKLEEELQELRSLNFEMLKDDFGHLNHGMGRYEKVLMDQLRKDGYLSEYETIESLEWNDDLLKVNGKKIREADEEKYREINRNYFNRRPQKKFE